MKPNIGRFALLAMFTFLAMTVSAGTNQVSPSTNSEIAELRAKAEKADAESQCNLGFIYAKGEGVPKDAAEAVKWFRKAAEQELASAQYNLGLMYAKGEGVPKDAAEAVKWFRGAAEQGLASAQYNLGLI